jgi:predicted nucleotidyltransferase
MGGLKREEIIQLLRKELPYLRERYGVKEVALFGSFAKGSEGEGSDVDILVELSKSLGLDFVELAYYLEEKLGRKVDLVTSGSYRSGLKNPKIQACS